MFYDIQNLKKAELASAEHQHLLQQINTATPDAITIFDLEQQQPVYLNNCLSEWTGISNEELVNMGITGRLQLLHPDDRERLLHFNRQLLQATDDKVFSIKYRLQTPKGVVWIRNRSKVFKRNSNGEVTHLFSVLQDITQELRLRKRLKERSRYAETLFESAADQMVLLNKEFSILAWNSKSVEKTGVRKEAAIGKNFFTLFPKLAEDAVIFDAFKKAARGQLVQLPPKPALYSRGIYERFFMPVKKYDGSTEAILLVVHDITQVVQQSNELAEKNRELEQKNEEILQFSFVASHDLKEPLRKLHLFSDWLLQHETPQLTDTGKNYISRLKESVNRMELLIEDILVLTKIHADRHLQDETSLQEVLHNVLADLQSEIDQSRIRIEADTLPVIMGNAHQLFNLFKNIISNAIKFQPPHARPSLRISTGQADGANVGQPGRPFLQISFADNGLGFNQQFANKIFQVFQRLHRQQDFKGTGIGLSICKKIMENHGGLITVESAEGKGSVFHCYFPQSLVR